MLVQCSKHAHVFTEDSVLDISFEINLTIEFYALIFFTVLLSAFIMISNCDCYSYLDEPSFDLPL